MTLVSRGAVMSWTYQCPKCSACLNPAETVVLTAARGKTWMLVGLHPEPGNYEVYLPPGIEVEAGERWDFFCPVCQEDLVSEEDENLCALTTSGEEGRATVLFSRLAGEYATFVVERSEIQRAFGEHIDRYDLAQAQLKYLV